MTLIDKLCEREEFLGASKEELRALIVLLSHGKMDAKALAEYAHISTARAKSALVLWEECGIFDGEIEDVYETRERPHEVRDEDRRTVAQTIQSEGLANLLDSCATLLDKPTLNDMEVKIITGLYSQYGLSDEYIFTLFSDIVARTTRPTVRKLEAEAIRRLSDGIDTTEALIEFFHQRDSLTEGERLVKRALHLGRTLSPSEKKIALRWTREYGYGEDIILLAYDFATASTQNPTLKYLDKILSDWHSAGITTVADATEYHEANKGKKPAKTSKKKEAPRYGNFDPDEAFRLALERSYGESEGEEQ